MVCGSASGGAGRSAAIHVRGGITHYLAWSRIGGLEHKKVLRSMELMCDKVMPQVRHLGEKALVSTAG